MWMNLQYYEFHKLASREKKHYLYFQETERVFAISP